MKQTITRFEKSTPRQLAYIFLGVGAIGLALTVGDNSLGFGLGSTAAWIMLAGFVLATVFLAIAGGSPVAVGTDTVDAEDRVTVQMSDELQGDIKKKVDAAIADLNEKHDAAISQMEKAGNDLVERVNSVNETLEKSNLAEVTSQLSKLAQGIDVESTSAAIENLKNSVGSVSEISSNLENTNTELSEKTAQLKEKMNAVESQLSNTLAQFQQFNHPG
jgi:molecular chaperone DnaK (HSP70)